LNFGGIKDIKKTTQIQRIQVSLSFNKYIDSKTKITSKIIGNE